MTGSTVSPESQRHALVPVALLAVAFAVAAAAAFAGSAAAGDNVGVFEFEPDDAELEPGETIEVDVALRSHGQYGDSGVQRLVLRVDYPTEYLTVTDVDAGDWFRDAPDGDPRGEGDGDIEVRESIAIDDDRGAARLEQSLSSPDSGVVGAATVATLTVEVSEDADAATVELDAAESEVHLTSRYPQPLSAAPAEVHVDGGGDVVSPEYAEAAFEADDGTDDEADERDERGDGDGTVEDGSNDGADDVDGNDSDSAAADDDAIPLSAAAAVVGVFIAAALFRRR